METKKETEVVTKSKKQGMSCTRFMLLIFVGLLIATPIAMFTFHFERIHCGGPAFPVDGDIG